MTKDIINTKIMKVTKSAGFESRPTFFCVPCVLCGYITSFFVLSLRFVVKPNSFLVAAFAALGSLRFKKLRRLRDNHNKPNRVQPIVAQYGSKLRSAGRTSVPKSLMERIKSSSAMSPMLNSPRTVLNNPSAAAALIFSVTVLGEPTKARL
jgi:hypothetical protein